MAQMVKNLPSMQETKVWFLGWKIPWRREWLPTPVFLPEESHGQRSLMGYSPWGCKELAMTEPLTLDDTAVLLCDFSGWVWTGCAASAFFSWDACSGEQPTIRQSLPPLRKPRQKGLLITALLSFQEPASNEKRPAWVSPGVSKHRPAEPSDGCSPYHYLTATSWEKLCDNRAATPLFLNSKPTKSLKMIVLNELVFGWHCYVLGQFVLQDQWESTFSPLTHLLTILAAHFHFWMFMPWLLKSISPWIDLFILYTYTQSRRGTATHVHTKSITWLRFIPQITFIKTSFLNWKKNKTKQLGSAGIKFLAQGHMAKQWPSWKSTQVFWHPVQSFSH